MPTQSQSTPFSRLSDADLEAIKASLIDEEIPAAYQAYIYSLRNATQWQGRYAFGWRDVLEKACDRLEAVCREIERRRIP